MRYGNHTTETAAKAQYYRALREQKIEGLTLSKWAKTQARGKLAGDFREYDLVTAKGNSVIRVKKQINAAGNPASLICKESAIELAVRSGLIPHEDIIYEQQRNRKLDDWFATEGLYDPRREEADRRHPLQGNDAESRLEDERQLDKHTERLRREMSQRAKHKAFWQDYRITDDARGVEPRPAMTEHKGEMIDLNAPGFFRWTDQETQRSSIDFGSNPIRTRRQIAGFITGTVGRKDLAIVQTGWVRNDKGRTPLYTVFISEKIPAPYLMAETAYASSLKMVDIESLTPHARHQSRCELALQLHQKRLKGLRETSLDEGSVVKAEFAAKKALVRLKKSRLFYSQKVARAFETAEMDIEPDRKLLNEAEALGLDFTYDNYDHVLLGKKTIITCDLRDLGDEEQESDQSDGDMQIQASLGSTGQRLPCFVSNQDKGRTDDAKGSF